MPLIRGNRRTLLLGRNTGGIDRNAYLTWLNGQDTLNGDKTVRWKLQDSNAIALAEPVSMNGVHHGPQKVAATGLNVLYAQKYDNIPFFALSAMGEEYYYSSTPANWMYRGLLALEIIGLLLLLSVA